MNKPKVSIIMPAYNQERYISECIESVINQTLKEIEIIIVNDGSKDSTLEILEKYQKNDPRICIINKENTGYGHSMNVGIEKANGEYIAIVETDDYIGEKMCEDLYQIASNNDLDFIKADFYRFYGEGADRKLEYGKLTEQDSYYNRIINAQEELGIFDLVMMNWAGIYKNSFLKKNNIRHNETPGASYQDNGFWFQVFCLAQNIFFLDKPYYCVRRDNPNSSIHNKEKVFCISEEYDFIYDFLCRDFLMKEKYMEKYAKAKYSNYVGVLNRISDEYKDCFLTRFARDFSYSINTKEFKKEFFGEKAWIRITEIIKKYGDNIPKLPGVEVRREYEYLSKLNPGLYKEELEIWYKRITKKELNINNPKTMNEKIQWSKLYDTNPKKANLADKYLVRDWVAKIIGEEYLIPILGVWKDYDDINIKDLPEAFVLKLNNGSGWNIITKDKKEYDYEKNRSLFKSWMKKDFSFEFGLELQYSLIEPRIIAEEYIQNDGYDLRDYKFLCVNGKVEYIWVDTNRYTDHRRDVFDRDWNHQNCYLHCPPADVIPERPDKLEEMVDIAEKLASDFNYLRVDLYYLNNGEIKFGEITFTSTSGTEQFSPPDIDIELGEKIQIRNYHTPVANPKMSVILPLYNAEADLRMCLNSITCQTLKEIEIICIDNFSEDYTHKILQEFREQDKRIKIIDRVSFDFSQSRDYGARIAKGEILVFLNQNNIFGENDSFETVYNRMQLGAEAVFCEEIRWKDRQKIKKSYLYNNAIKDSIVSQGSFEGMGLERVFFKKEIVDKALFSDSLFNQFEKEELYRILLNKAKIVIGIDKIILESIQPYNRRFSFTNQKSQDLQNEASTQKFLIEAAQKDRKIVELHEEINKIRSSKSFKIGRIITWPLRMFKATIKSLKENGVRITYRKIISKVKWVITKIFPRLKSFYQKPHRRTIFSVIVPVFNAERYLRECIESLVKQTFLKIEFIFVDDGSTDNSLSIIKEYQRKDKRIRIFSQQNQGAGIARNHGLKKARGEYVHFLDSDDWVDLTMYATLFQKIHEEKPDICMFFYRNYDNVLGTFTSSYFPIKSPQKYVISKMRDNPQYFLNNSFVVPWNKVYRKGFLNKNKLRFSNLNCANDRPFYFEVLLVAKSIMVLDAVLINYRINNSSSLVGQNRSKNYHCQFESFEISEPKYRKESSEILKKFIQISLGDFFYFYNKAEGEDKDRIENMLNEYFLRMDLTPLGEDIKKSWWYADYKRIIDKER